MSTGEGGLLQVCLDGIALIFENEKVCQNRCELCWAFVWKFSSRLAIHRTGENSKMYNTERRCVCSWRIRLVINKLNNRIETNFLWFLRSTNETNIDSTIQIIDGKLLKISTSVRVIGRLFFFALFWTCLSRFVYVVIVCRRVKSCLLFTVSYLCSLNGGKFHLVTIFTTPALIHRRRWSQVWLRFDSMWFKEKSKIDSKFIN